MEKNIRLKIIKHVQIEKYCYDNLFALRLANSFSDGNHFYTDEDLHP